MNSKLTSRTLPLITAVIYTLGWSHSTLFAQSTAFTYQGRLSAGGSNANGTYDIRLAIYDAPALGTPQGSTFTSTGTVVSNGLFTVTHDFGNQFPGADRWLEIAVSTNGANSFTTLTPRQMLTPTPYSVMARNVASGGLAAGTYGNPVTLNNAANNISGTFTGNGAGLTSLNASQLTSGVIPNLLLSNTVALLDRSQIFTGDNVFRNPTNNSGSIRVGANAAGPDPKLIKFGDGDFVTLGENGADDHMEIRANQFSFLPSYGFGYVGIGTGVPSKPLVVQKRATTEPAIMVGGALPGGPRIQTYGLDADANAWMGLGADMGGGPYEHSLYFPVGNNNGRFTVGSYDGTNYSTKLAVDINGNIRWGNGSLLSSDANGIIELGSPSSAGQQPIIDFHFGVGSVQDYNVRIINDVNETLSLFRASSGVAMARFNSGGLTVNGTFVSTSDRNAKENFKSISAESVLEKVLALPVSQWNYKEDKSSEHIGPMAQDFYAAFKVGPDDKHIASVDEAGVALAAIQGLNQKLEATRAENADLKQQLAELKQLVQSIAARH